MGTRKTARLEKMTYFDLVCSHIKRNGGDSALIAAVADYLENANPQDEPPWSQEFEDNVT